MGYAIILTIMVVQNRLEICYAKIVFRINSYQNTVTYRSITSPLKPSTVPSVIAVGALSGFVVVITVVVPTLNDWKKLFHFKNLTTLDMISNSLLGT